MNIVLWLIQGLLGLAFLMAGGSKLIMPIEELAVNMSFVNEVPALMVRFIGFAELLGAIGLIVPSATRILPWLTPLAAAGLATVMVLAIPMHLSLGEPFGAIIPSVVLMHLSVLVAVGRTKFKPISGRNADDQRTSASGAL